MQSIGGSLAGAIAANKCSNAPFQRDPDAGRTEIAEVLDKEAFNLHCQDVTSAIIRKRLNASGRQCGVGNQR